MLAGSLDDGVDNNKMTLLQVCQTEMGCPCRHGNLDTLARNIQERLWEHTLTYLAGGVDMAYQTAMSGYYGYTAMDTHT